MVLADTQSERAILGAVLDDPSCFESIELADEDFQDADCRLAWSKVRALIDAGKRPDLTLLGSEMADRPKFLAELNPITAANASYYAERIRECSKRRGIVAILRKAKELIDGPVDAVLEAIEAGLVELQGQDRRDMRMLRDLLDPAMAVIEERYKLQGRTPGIETGFHRLDAPLGGMRKGNLIIIGGRPSMGKTALALSMALNMATHEVRVGFFSLEMSAEQLVIRALANVGRINSQSLASGHMGPADFAKILDAGAVLQRASVIIDDTPNIALTLLKNRARRMKRLGVEIVFVDYLTLIRHGDARTPRWERVGDVSKNLKQLARELDIPIVVLSQVARDAEDRMPTLADLRMSGEVEEDSDVVLLMHRDRAAAEGEQDYTTQIDIAKNRHGATQMLELVFLPTYVSFEEKFEGGGGGPQHRPAASGRRATGLKTVNSPTNEVSDADDWPSAAPEGQR
ncbi:MAG: AAA family ATPase [Actinomycetia bacterium]|nr:AAA family ATPase [Actinomycetes bacterium]